MPDTPMFQDTLSYSGQNFRDAMRPLTMATGSTFGARAGVRPGDPGLTTSLAGSTINVSPGTALVSGQGIYVGVLTSTWSGPLTAAHATLPRIDLVYLRIWDTDFDASGLRKTDVVYLAGTASSTPVAPTPAGTQIYMPLATISVPASGGGSPTVSLAVRPYTVAPGGILPLQSSAPSTPYVGQYYDDQTNLRRYNGSSWDTLQKVESVGWTTVTLAAGYTQGDTTTNGNLNGPIRYRKFTERGTDYMEWDGGGQRTSGTQVSNILNAALAASFRPAGRASFSIARNATSITGVANSASVVHSCKIDFNQDGTVSLVSATAGDTEVAWFSLRGLRYALA
ncbi:hypothetical protein OOK29_26120 [Streptomyces phaeochromogenes]|uniref:hypothetical protein n=1 Tax=Streptomyces phaeochromogenes TaxID=1923 RepID=UPI0022545E84|nr:hypothetical protein [Streptomyces phaeochromogenes]MCX5601632.1 hypothetical protein [Streptomyces phaeochromogenes]